MKKLSPPLTLIRDAFYIFIAKENLIYFLKLVGIIILASFLAVGTLFIIFSLSPLLGKDSPLIIVPMLVGLLAFVVFAIWAQTVTFESVVRVVEKKELKLKDTFKVAWTKAGKFFLLSLVLTVLVSFGFILLIIPGIILAVWLSFSQYILISEGLRTKASLVKSRNLVKGYFFAVLGRYLVFTLVFMLIQILLSIVPFFGSLAGMFLGPFFLLPSFLLYRELRENKLSA